MSRDERLGLIERIEQLRQTHVISYVTSTRPNLESPMAMDVIPVLFRHLQGLTTPPEETRIDLFIHSNGGEGVVPWRLVSLIREYCSQFSVLVPHHAFSAATLTALGADEVFMHPMGMLGPTDATVANEFNPPNPRMPGQVLGISVEDVTSYIALIRDDVGIHHEDELVQAFLALANQVHPLALGNVKRSTSQSRMMGERLLGRRGGDALDPHQIQEIIDKLTSQLYYHGHPINRREANEELGLPFVKAADGPLSDAMWDLYSAYARLMSLDKPFLPVIDAIQIGGMPPRPAPTAPPTITDVTVGTQKAVYVESLTRCDCYEVDLEVTLVRQADGLCSGQAHQSRVEWTEETAADG